MESLADPLRDEAFVAKKLKVKKETLQNWRYRGGGPPFVKVGSLVRYTDEAVQRWIEERTVRSTSQR